MCLFLCFSLNSNKLMLFVVDHGEALLYNNNCTISTLSSYIAWYNGDLPIKSMALIS